MNPELLERIETYLLGQMEEAETQSFESEIADNEQLAMEVEQVKSLFTGIEASAIRERVGELIAAEETQKQGKSIRFRSVFAIGFAVAAAVAVLLAVFLWPKTEAQQLDALYAEFKTPDPGLPGKMGSSNNYALDDAMVDYKQGNWEVAISKFETLANDESASDTVLYYLAMCFAESGRDAEAIDYLKRAENLGGEYQQKAEWQHALMDLKRNEPVQVRYSLQRIASNPEHPYYHESVHLLEKLNLVE